MTLRNIGFLVNSHIKYHLAVGLLGLPWWLGNAYHSKRFKNYSILRMVLLCLKESCFPDCWKVSLVVLVFKACVRYFLTNFYFSPNDNPVKIMKDVFYFIERALFVLVIFKFLYFYLPLFFSLSVIALELDPW